MGSIVVFEAFVIELLVLIPKVPIDATFFYSILVFENKNQLLMICHLYLLLSI